MFDHAPSIAAGITFFITTDVYRPIWVQITMSLDSKYLKILEQDIFFLRLYSNTIKWSDNYTR